MKRRVNANMGSGPTYEEVSEGLRDLIAKLGGDPDEAEMDMAWGDATELIFQLASGNTMTNILDRYRGR